MTATKAMERKALAKIQKIVEDLGEGSYLSVAFEGCFEDAESNIKWDMADSWKQRAESLEKRLDQAKQQIKDLEQGLDVANKVREALQSKCNKLRRDLDKELEWHDCEGGTNMSQNKYEDLKSASSSELLEEKRAAELVAMEFGFDISKIRIVHEAKTYQANKYGHTRVKDTFNRDPYFNAWDWNYIRFDVAGMPWEMVDGSLRQYAD